MGVSYMQHHPHQHQQGQAPHLQQHSRPSSIVHQQHHQPPSQPPQHSNYSSSHSIPPVYQQQSQASNAQHSQEGIQQYYAGTHQNSYSTAGQTSGYPSAGEYPDQGLLYASRRVVSLIDLDRYLRHDGRNNAQTTIPPNVIPYAAI